jgi:hypothetical protein
MADPIIKAWGPLKLTKALIDPTDASLSATDKEELFKLTTIDCFPPPKATTSYNKPKRIVPAVQPRSLQQSEKTNLTNIKDLFGGKPSTLKGIQTAIETKLDLDAMLISYSSEKYKALQKLYPCFTNDIYLRVRYAVFEIKVSASQAVTLGTDQFPPGDEIATYRIRELWKYRFESHLTWNKKCCAQEPAETPTTLPTEYFAALSETLIEEINVTGKRLKNSLPPKPIKPMEEEWGLGLGLGYELEEWNFDFDWSKFHEDD